MRGSAWRLTQPSKPIRVVASVEPGDAVNLIVEARNPRDEANAKVRCVTEAEVIAAVSQLVHEGYEYIRVTDSAGIVAADVVVRATV
jgi:hypothetical protein